MQVSNLFISSWVQSGVMKVVLKTSDQTVNNSTVLVNDTELKHGVLANETWAFELHLLFNSAAAAGLDCSFTGPAGSTVKFGTHDNDSLAVVTGGNEWALSGGAADRMMVFTGVIINGATAGDLQFKWAQNAAQVSDSDVQEGSSLRLMKV